MKLTAKKLIFSSMWLVLDRLLKMAVGLYVGVMVARTLGPSDYGVYAYVLTVFSVLQCISALGIDPLISRDISKPESNKQKIVGTAYFMKLTTGVICLLFAFLLDYFEYIEYGKYSFLLTIVVISLLFTPSEIIEVLLQASGRSQKIFLIKTISFLVVSIAKIAAIFYQVNNLIEWIVYLFVVEFILNNLLFLLPYQKNIKKIPIMSYFMDMPYYFKQTFPLLISGLAIIIYMKIDLIFIKYYLNDRSVGLYSAMTVLSGAFYFIPLVINTALIPYFSRLKNESIILYRKKMANAMILYIVVGAFVSGILFIFGGDVFLYLYGDGYVDVLPALKIHCFANIFIYSGVGQIIWMINEGKTNLVMKKTIWGLVSAVVLNVILVPILGLVGAALSAIGAQFLSSVVANIVHEKELSKIQFGILH